MLGPSKTPYQNNSKFNNTKRSQMNIVTRSNETSKDKRALNSSQTRVCNTKDEINITSRVFSNCNIGDKKKQYYSKYKKPLLDASNIQNINSVNSRENLYRKISHASKNEAWINKTSDNYIVDFEECKENIKSNADLTVPKTLSVKLSDINSSMLGRNLALKGIIRNQNTTETTNLTRQSTSVTVDKSEKDPKTYDKEKKRSYLDYMAKSRMNNLKMQSLQCQQRKKNTRLDDETDCDAKDFMAMKQAEAVSQADTISSMPNRVLNNLKEKKAEVVKIKNLKISDLNINQKSPINNCEHVNELRNSYMNQYRRPNPEANRTLYSKSFSRKNTMNTQFFSKKSQNLTIKHSNTISERMAYEPVQKPIIKNINDYQFNRVLGKGSYAQVRLATHKKDKSVVAIKTYEKSKQLDPLKKGAVDREIKLLQQLDHENIIKYIDCYYDKLQINLLMEYPGQRSLYEYVKTLNGKIDEGEAKLIFHQIFKAVHYLHCLSISHRDIKLENILYTKAGVIKLIDFGFAVQSKDKLRTFCGTPTYMAPELVKKSNYFGPDVDRWALGVLIYRTLTGIYPFKAQKDRDQFKKINSGVYDMKLLPNTQVRDLIAKLLKVNPTERPDCKELLSHPWFKQEKRYNLDEFYRSPST